MKANEGTFLPFPDFVNEIYALGLTYRSHIKESGEKAGDPVIFDKTCHVDVEPEIVSAPSHSDMFAALDDLDASIAERMREQFPQLPGLLDYEVEIGMILLEAVDKANLEDPNWMPKVGYFLANDITVRSVQIAGQLAEDRYAYWSASKSFPGFLPVAAQIWSPEVAAPDDLPDIRLELKVNNEVRQSEPVSDIIFTPRQMIEIVSGERPNGCLKKGDVILTGTPSGVALGMSPLKALAARLLPPSLLVKIGIRSGVGNPRFLKPGDIVEQSAKWLGSFSFRIT